MTQEITSLPLITVNQPMSDDYREKVVRQALEYLKAGKGNATLLDKALRQVVLVRGFDMHPTKAKLSQLLPQAVKGFQRSNEVVAAILTLWVAANYELAARMRDFFSKTGIELNPLGPLSKHFIHYHSFSETNSHLEIFRQQYPDDSQDDFLLMYICLRGSLYIPEHSDQEENEDMSHIEQTQSHHIWTDWLEKLRPLPANSPVWATIDDFISELQTLAEYKNQERQGLIRLQEALDELCEVLADQPDFIEEFAGCSDWQADLCPADQVIIATEKIIELRQTFTDYKVLEQQPPTRLSEKQSWHQKLMTLSDYAIKIYQQLQAIFAPDLPPVGNQVRESAAENTAAAEDSSPSEDEPAILSSVPLETSFPELEVILDADADRGEEAETIEDEPGLSDREVQEFIPPPGDTDTWPNDSNPDPSKFDKSDGIDQPLLDGAAAVPDSSLTNSETFDDTITAEDLDLVPTEEPVEFTPEDNDVVFIDPTIPGTEVVETPPLMPGSEVEPDISVDQPSVQADFLWQLLLSNDVAGAYWFTRSLETRAVEVLVPSWLLAALQGARWLEKENTLILEALARIPYDHELDPILSHQILGLAAALYPALIIPESNMAGWINGIAKAEWIRPFPGLNAFVGIVSEFANRGLLVYPEVLENALTQEEREAELKELVQEARKWVAEAPERLTSYARATFVWRYLAKNRTNSLLEFLDPVANDDRTKVTEVWENIQKWNDRSFVINRIQEIDHELIGRRLSPIEATAREQIIRRVAEACQLADQWCRPIRRERQLQEKGNWLTREVQDFVRLLKDHFPAAEADLSEMSTSNERTDLAAATYQLQITFEQLHRLLHMESGSTSIVAEPLYPPLKGDLYQSLTYRLLWLPGCQLDDNGLPTEIELTHLAARLGATLDKEQTIEQILLDWFDHEDYRFVKTLLEIITDPGREAELNQQYRERRGSSRQRLDRLIAQTNDEIEQALVDGVIYAEDRSELSAQVESIKKVAPTLENIGAARHQLQDVCNKLQVARDIRIKKQHEIWSDLKEQLARTMAQPDQVKAIVTTVERAIENRAVRVVDEYLAQLKNSAGGGSAVDLTLFRESPIQRDNLKEFVTELPGLLRFLESPDFPLARIAREIPNRKSFRELNLGNLPTSRLQEVAEAIEAWRQLKSRQQIFTPENQAKDIATLLRYLGFRFLGSIGRSVRLERQLDSDASYWQANISAAGLAPVPQFGSEQEGRFHIVCIWDRLGFDTIGAVLQSLNVQNYATVVFYFGRLNLRQREDLTNFCRGDQPLTIAVLDEALLLLLAREYEARLGAFLECALPFTIANPYSPFAAGTVPPEMFFGRREMVRALQQPSGPCIIYGGRQLGKSALLRQVFREFHAPERQQYVLLEEIKLLGDPTAGQDPDDLWRRLRDGLVNLGLIDRKTSERPERLREEILKIMTANPHRRLLILLDEADKFLDVDAQRNFQIVSQLKALMDATQRRFKVIFAGLHNVQRFQGISNQPLAHMGTPLIVGPLEPDAALDLVQKRMAALGFRFSDRLLVLRILSYTNYHPGLIQLFCHKLVQYLYKQKVRGLPPYSIDETAIENVYRQSEVRNEIRTRFEWTLALDDRYKVIALAMIVDQLKARDSFSQMYNQQALYKLAEGWWADGFSQIKSHQFKGYLEEMCGLGVLTHTEGGYRLRSPNLVRLMGTEEEIWQNLEEVTAKPPEIEFDADSHHALLDSTVNRYSPLTYAQERLLNPHNFGVGLVFGSDALGLNYLREATKRFVPEELIGQKAHWESIDHLSSRGRTLETWFEKFIESHKNFERLIVYHSLRGTTAELNEQVEVALKICHRFKHRRDQWLRVIFAFDPASTWEWLQLPEDKRTDLENRLDAVIALSRWNLTGVRQRLRQHQPEMLSSEESCQAVLKATGGWHWLLDEFIKQCAGQTDPQPQTDLFLAALSGGDPTLRQGFAERFGKFSTLPAMSVFRFICQEDGPVPIDLIPEMLKDDASLGNEICKSALDFLEHMGLIERRGEDVIAEPISRLAFDNQ